MDYNYTQNSTEKNFLSSEAYCSLSYLFSYYLRKVFIKKHLVY